MIRRDWSGERLDIESSHKKSKTSLRILIMPAGMKRKKKF